jgi:hypothetical protein
VEPTLAADPTTPGHLVGAWQQDRWSEGGGADGIASALSFDGGQTWTPSRARFTRCGGGGPGSYDRASDPWVAFAPDGTVHQIALALDDPWRGARVAIVASRSGDGGSSWSEPVELAGESTADVALDKCTIAADPGRPGTLYGVWDRLAGLRGPAPLQTGPAWLARSADGGISWEPARAIYDPGPDAQTISNQVAVLPDGTLLNLLVIIEAASSAAPRARIAVLRSIDAGASWSPPIAVADLLAVGTSDPRTGHPVRDGSLVPQIAVDPTSGRVQVAWQDARFSAGAHDGIALSTSSDGGLGWSPPLQVNRAPGSPAFTPSVAVDLGGRLAVSYYDLRLADPGDPSGLWTVFWLATSGDGGVTWDEAALGGPFDLRLAPDVGGYFLGDYQALVGLADSFAALFSMGVAPRSGGARVFAGPFAGPFSAPAAATHPASTPPWARPAPPGLADLVRRHREARLRRAGRGP